MKPSLGRSASVTANDPPMPSLGRLPSASSMEFSAPPSPMARQRSASNSPFSNLSTIAESEVQAAASPSALASFRIVHINPAPHPPHQAAAPRLSRRNSRALLSYRPPTANFWPEKKDIGKLFRRWDSDADGSISAAEFRDGFRSLGLVPLQDGDAALNAMLRSADVDQNGRLEERQFANLIRNHSRESFKKKLEDLAKSAHLDQDPTHHPESCRIRFVVVGTAAHRGFFWERLVESDKEIPKAFEDSTFQLERNKLKQKVPEGGGASPDDGSSTCSAIGEDDNAVVWIDVSHASAHALDMLGSLLGFELMQKLDEHHIGARMHVFYALF
jgi:hypothetical protein